MIQTNHNTYKSRFYSEDDCEHDDVMTADDYERKEYYRNNWNESVYDRQRF
jgi:hypothetical protein